MKTLLNPWFIIGCICWAIVIVFRKMGHPLPFVNGYLGDAFALPVIANLALWFQRVVTIKNNYYVLGPWQVTFMVAYVSVVFEGLLPWLSKNLHCRLDGRATLWRRGIVFLLGDE